ncbi:MAG: membrane dipeptidase [Longimicrobiales bacterium]|nr:membrane dipeptidase [Longimicrobiales bacterium]
MSEEAKDRRDRGLAIRRREFLRRTAVAAVAPLVAGLGCGRDGGTSGRGDRSGRRDRPGSEAGTGPISSVPELMRVEWGSYDDVVVIDGLASPIQFNIPQERLPLASASLDEVRRSGITAVNVTVNARPIDAATAYERTLARISSWTREVDAHPEVLALARSVDEVREAKRTGRLGLIYGLQDGTPFEDDLDRLEELYVAGVRIVQPTYNVQNQLGSGALVPDDAGLTELGLAAVDRMEALGMLLDLSHCGPRTTSDGIQAASGPVAITHSGCAAVHEHPRNKDDATLRMLAERGGVVGIYLMPFLNPEGPPTAMDVLRHIEHALDVCGEDHVGIGSDQGIVPLDTGGDFRQRFEEVSRQRATAGIAAPREDTVPYVPQLNHPRRMETIAGMMSDHGHPDRVIEKVIGANFMRLFAEVWS